MSDYKRITMKDEEYGNYVQNIGSELNNPKIAFSYNGKIYGSIIDRLAELEDKIENGTLIEMPRIIHPNRMEWYVQYQYPNGVIQYYICFSKAEAEARLEQIRNGEQQ